MVAAGIGVAFPGNETHDFCDELEGDVVGGAVSVLGENEERFALTGFVFVFVLVLFVVFLFGPGVVGAGEESDHVGVLLDGAGFTQVGKHGALALALFDGSVELGENDDGDVEFLGDAFETGGDFGDLDLAVFLGALGAGGHQLEIIDGDELDVELLFESAGLGAELHDVEAGGFIDVEFGLLELAAGGGHGAHLFAVEHAAFEFAHVDAGTGGDESLHEDGGAHLQAEEGNGAVFVDGGVFDDVHRERGFPHGRTGGDDEHLPALQAGAEVVEFGVAGRESAQHSGVAQQLLNGMHGFVDMHVEGFDGVARLGVFADGEDARLYLVEEIGNVFLVFVGGLDAVGAGRDDAAQQVLVMQDTLVVGVVG